METIQEAKTSNCLISLVMLMRLSDKKNQNLIDCNWVKNSFKKIQNEEKKTFKMKLITFEINWIQHKEILESKLSIWISRLRVWLMNEQDLQKIWKTLERNYKTLKLKQKLKKRNKNNLSKIFKIRLKSYKLIHQTH